MVLGETGSKIEGVEVLSEKLVLVNGGLDSINAFPLSLAAKLEAESFLLGVDCGVEGLLLSVLPSMRHFL